MLYAMIRRSEIMAIKNEMTRTFFLKCGYKKIDPQLGTFFH
jgi:hypothetical protein